MHIGVLGFSAVDAMESGAITEDEARQAGFSSLAALLKDLGPDDERAIYRVSLHLAGPDPRVALRDADSLDAAAVAELQRRLGRFDAASPTGPWTATALGLIAAHAGRRAPDLAAIAGLETLAFKRNVRKLKELGLTESLVVGYRLSPRGERFVGLAAARRERVD